MTIQDLLPLFAPADAYFYAPVTLTGDVLLNAVFPTQGRLAIRHVHPDRSPVVLMSTLADTFEIKIFGDTRGEQIEIHTTHLPTSCRLVPI